MCGRVAKVAAMVMAVLTLALAVAVVVVIVALGVIGCVVLVLRRKSGSD